MANELITYGMVREKGHTVAAAKENNEYAIRADFLSGGAVGLILNANLSEYESNELVKNSSIPSAPSSMTINFSGVLSGYSYAFITGTGLMTGLIPMVVLANGVITYNLPMAVYNSNTGQSQQMSSGIVSVYRKPTLGSNWALRTSFTIAQGSNISVNV